MKYTPIYIAAILCILAFTSCEKEEFIGDPGTPVFTAEIPFQNEETLNLVAGDDLYYMFASHQQLELSKIFSGLFGKEDNCEEDCAENFSIRIVEDNTATEGPLPLGKYEYYSIPRDGFKHDFSVHSSDEDAINAATWILGETSETGPTFSINSLNDSAPQEKMQMIYDVPGQLVARFERPIIPKAVDCNCELKVKRAIGQGLFMEVETNSPFTLVNWSNGTTGKRMLVDFNTQSYSANIFDAHGCQTKLIVFFKTQNIAQDYNIALNQESYMFTIPDNSDRSVIIEYTDAEGVFYTSSIIGQILPFNFEIHSVEAYDNNELGEPTWKIDSSFDCILFGENGKSKRIIDGKAIFAVSY